MSASSDVSEDDYFSEDQELGEENDQEVEIDGDTQSVGGDAESTISDDYYDYDWELDPEPTFITGYRSSSDAMERPNQNLADPADPRSSLLGIPASMPYPVETMAEMDERLDFICKRLAESVKASEYTTSFRFWDGALTSWMSMQYPMTRSRRVELVNMYYEVCFMPSLHFSMLDCAGTQLVALVASRKVLDIRDIRLDWRPILRAMQDDLFPTFRNTGRNGSLSPLLINIAEACQRFFHPSDIDEMLEEILPRMNGADMDSILATQAFLCNFLPIDYPQKWLPLIFNMWTGIHSGFWDDQACDVLGQLATVHVNPARSNPTKIAKVHKNLLNTPEQDRKKFTTKADQNAHKLRMKEAKGDVVDDEDGLTYWVVPDDDEAGVSEDEHAETKASSWQGIRKDVGIFSDQEFEMIMSKCLRSLNVPVGGALASANAMSVTASDGRVSKKITNFKKSVDRVQSLAEIIVYSMAVDGPSPQSNTATPSGAVTPVPAAVSRLQASTKMQHSLSTDSLAAAGKKSEAAKAYLGGSKALDHLAKLITACETFFHPSNNGTWTAFLTCFLHHLTSNFLERWKAEQAPNCKTPMAWRLTPEIRREFVLCLRPVALSAMFSKDMSSLSPTVTALKSMAVLEPDLVMPEILERALPSLQGLEETFRTPAVTYTLATSAYVLSARQIYPQGGRFIPQIFELLLPGIDMNDPSKTAIASLAISSIADIIRIGDISDFEGNVPAGKRSLRATPRTQMPIDLFGGESEMERLSPEEENSQLRYATAAFRDWVPEFIARVLLLFSNLPEEGGRSGRAGGKSEMMTLSSVLHACGRVFVALDDKLFDAALEQIVTYATTTCRANAVSAVGELVHMLADVKGTQTFERFFPLCEQRITSELDLGASSTRTTTTSIPLAGDAALHWWQSILYSILAQGRVDLSQSPFRHRLVKLLSRMASSTLSERGYSFTGKIFSRVLSCLLAYFRTEANTFEPDETASDDVKENHHLWWGRLYRASEVTPSYRKPTEDDIAMAFEICDVVGHSVKELEALIASPAFGDKNWASDYCRHITVVEAAVGGTYNLLLEIPELKQDGKPWPIYIPLEFVQRLPAYKTGHLLSDPNDARFQQHTAFRERVSNLLHDAAMKMRDVGNSESSVEAVKLTVRGISSLLTGYGMRSKTYSTAVQAFNYNQAARRSFGSQKNNTRLTWITRSFLHHQNRMTHVGYHRLRSKQEDTLIEDLLELSLSPFVRIRKYSQVQLDQVTRIFIGCSVLCYQSLFDALKPGTDPDRMKGALYVLRNNVVGQSRIMKDWRILGEYVQLLLRSYHQEKASVSALVAKTIDEALGLIHMADAAVARLEASMGQQLDLDMIQRVADGHKKRIEEEDVAWNDFVDQILTIAEEPELSWRFALSALRFLSLVMRRDRPADPRLAKFFLSKVTSDHPRIRDYAESSATRLLQLLRLRTFCQGSELRLLAQDPVHPLSFTVGTQDISADTPKYLQQFRTTLAAGQEKSTPMFDTQSSGWLVWGKELRASRVAAWDEEVFVSEPESAPVVATLKEMTSDPAWWQKLADFWAQEDARRTPSSTHIYFAKVIAQLVGYDAFVLVQPILGQLLKNGDGEKNERDQTRCFYEMLSGFVRGSIHWPGKDRAALWSWLGPLLPAMFSKVRQDTIKCWDVFLDYMLSGLDPRRLPDLYGFIFQTILNIDFNGASAYQITRRIKLVRSVMHALQWRFSAWAADFTKLFFSAISNTYAEVRNVVAVSINNLDQVQVHPSYPSVKALMADVLNPNVDLDLFDLRTGRFLPELRLVLAALPTLKLEREGGPKAILSAHDTSASTILVWLTHALGDIHAAAAFPYVLEILPIIFDLREHNDSPELQKAAANLLALVTAVTPPLELTEPLLLSLVDTLQNSPSWKIRLHVLPVLSVVYFRTLALLSDQVLATILDVMSKCLRDENQEVREMASASLAGLIRCSERRMVNVLKTRFLREIKAIQLPHRRDAPGKINPDYQAKLSQLHGSLLGVVALIEAFPYTVPAFIPGLLTETLAAHASDPPPISTTIQSCAASFNKTHSDTWRVDKEKFTEDQLSNLTMIVAGTSYYA